MAIPVHHEPQKNEEKPPRSDWPMVVLVLGTMIIIGALCIAWKVTP